MPASSEKIGYIFDEECADLDQDGHIDCFRVYSAYPVAAGEGSYETMLSWEDNEETIAAVPVPCAAPVAVRPEILQLLQGRDGEPSYLLLGYTKVECKTGQDAFKLYEASKDGLRKIDPPAFAALFFAPERLQPLGVTLMRRICELFGEPGKEKQLRIGWKGPYSIDRRDGELLCGMTLYLLDSQSKTYLEWEAALSLANGAWQLNGYDAARQITDIGLDTAMHDTGGLLGCKVTLGDGGEYRVSRPDIPFAVSRRYPHTLIRQGSLFDRQVTARRNPSFHADAYTVLSVTSSGEGLLAQEHLPNGVHGLEQVAGYLGTPLYRDDTMLVYPMQDNTNRIAENSRFEVAEFAGYSLYSFADGALASFTQYAREEYSLFISGFAEQNAFCVTLSDMPIGVIAHDDNYRISKYTDDIYTSELVFPLGRTALLTPDGLLNEIGPSDSPFIAYAFAAKDVDADNDIEYLLTGVEKSGTAAYAFDEAPNGGYNALVLARGGAYGYTEEENRFREICAEEIPQMWDIFNLTGEWKG